MGAVYYGAGPDGRRVAVKVIRRELAMDTAFRARFEGEVANARRVASFCTAQVLDHGAAGGQPYMVTEFIEGPSLTEYVERHGAFPAGPLRALAAGIATALTAIHAVRLVHRDLKPANVLLSAGGPRVIDFGIARALDSTAQHTQTGFVVGSPGWIAPEQVFDGKVGTAGDVFTWGSLVAYAASGRHPYGSGNLMVLAARAQQGEHDLGELPGDIRPLVAAALEADPAARPSAQDLLVALVGADEDPQTAAGRLVTASWQPGSLPPAIFAPPSLTPPPAQAGAAAPPMPMSQGPPIPAPASPVAFSSTLPPFAPPPPAAPPPGPPSPGMPGTPPPASAPPVRPRSSGLPVLLAALGTVILLAVGGGAIYWVNQDSDDERGKPGAGTQSGPSSSGPAAGAAPPPNAEVTALPELCKPIGGALPPKARGIKEDHNRTSDDTETKFCKWQSLKVPAARHLAVNVSAWATRSYGSGIERAKKEYNSNWENAGDPEYHKSREQLTGLGDQAYASHQVSPIIYGPSEAAAKSYWMGGAEVTIRRGNLTVEVTWMGADYPANVRGKLLQGQNFPYAQAKQQAIDLAKFILTQIR